MINRDFLIDLLIGIFDYDFEEITYSLLTRMSTEDIKDFIERDLDIDLGEYDKKEYIWELISSDGLKKFYVKAKSLDEAHTIAKRHYEDYNYGVEGKIVEIIED